MPRPLLLVVNVEVVGIGVTHVVVCEETETLQVSPKVYHGVWTLETLWILLFWFQVNEVLRALLLL